MTIQEELAESKRRECDAKDMEQVALEHAANWEERVLAAEAEVEAAKRREEELQAQNWDICETNIKLAYEKNDLAARVKTLEDAMPTDRQLCHFSIFLNESSRICFADDIEAVNRLFHVLLNMRREMDLKQALAAKEPKELIRPVNDKLPDVCHCSPGNCMAPVIMGFQTPCRDPQKAAGERK